MNIYQSAHLNDIIVNALDSFYGFKAEEISTNAIRYIAHTAEIVKTDMREFTDSMDVVNANRMWIRLQNTGLVFNSGIKGGFTNHGSERLKDIVNVSEAMASDELALLELATDDIAESLNDFDSSFKIERRNCHDDMTCDEPVTGFTALSMTQCMFYGALLVLWLVLVFMGGIESMAFMSVMPAINRKSIQCLLDVPQDDIDAAYDTRLQCARTLCARTDTDYQAMSAATIAATGTMRRRTTIVLRDMIKTFNAIHNGTQPVNELGHRVTVMQAVAGDNPCIHNAVTDLHRGLCEGYDAAQVLTGIKGLGPAKSAFSIQLIEPDAMTVCIDIRNVRTFGINADLKRQLRDSAFYTEFCDRMRNAYDECRYGEKKVTSDFSDAVWALWVNGLADEYSLTRNQVNEYHVRWCEIAADTARVLCTEKYGHTPESILTVLRKEHWLSSDE